jgi:hypothetical protein
MRAAKEGEKINSKSACCSSQFMILHPEESTKELSRLPMRTFNMRMTVKKKKMTIIIWNPGSLLVKPLATGSYIPPYEYIEEILETSVRSTILNTNTNTST